MRGDPPPNPVFVLGGRFPALGVVHSLSARGVRCWVCESARLQATWSRHARYWRIPDPRANPQGMLDRLYELYHKVGGRPVVIPTADHYARALARHRDDLEKNMIPCVAPPGVVDLLVDKLRFSGWTSSQGVDSPTAAPGTAAVLPFAPPVVVKPVNFNNFLIAARDLPRGEKQSDLRFTLIPGEPEWQAFRNRYRAILKDLVLQEYVEGNSNDMYSIGIYADRHSRLLGVFVGRKIRGYPAQYGNTILGQNDRVPAHVLDEVAAVTRDLGYQGIAEFEYRKEPGSDRFRLLEINPRCWSWIGATSMSVADIPWIAYRDLSGRAVDPVIDNAAPGSIKAVRVMADMANVFWRYRRDHPPWLMSPRAWLKSLAADQLSLVEFARGDLGVSLFCFALLLRDLVKDEH